MQFIHEIPQRRAEATPESTCLYLSDAPPVSYGELWLRISAASSWLRDHGVEAGHRVMLVCENSVEHIVLLFACSTLNAWPVAVNARLSAGEIRSIADHCEPRLIFFTSGTSSPAAQHARDYQASSAESPALAGNHYCLYHSEAAPEPTELAQAVATLVYTSGTTGAPKGVMVTHKGLLHFAGSLHSHAACRHTTSPMPPCRCPIFLGLPPY